MGVNINSRAYILLKKYISRSITKDDFEELKLLISTSEDKILNHALETLWNDSFTENSMQAGKKELDEALKEIGSTITKQKRTLFIRHLLRVAAFITIPLLISAFGFLFQDWSQLRDLGNKDVIVSIERGQKGKVILPDSSVVYLNAESLLSYKQNFGYKDRDVNLKGEGFFEVKKGLSNKFHVFTEYLKIEVLGTSFNVYAYDDDRVVEMALISGQVLVQVLNNPGVKMIVKPNEKISFDKKTGLLNLHKTDTQFETAWLRGELVFRSEPIRDVLEKLGRKYGIQFNVYGKWDTDDLFTGSFDCEEIEEVMNVLKRHYSIEYKIRGESVSIYTQME